MVKGVQAVLAIMLCALVGTSISASARSFRLVKGEKEKVCRHVLNRINEAWAHKEVNYFFLGKVFPKPELQRGSYFVKSEKGKGQRFVRVAEFDINNDGKDEILAFQNLTLRSQDGDELLVFKKGEINLFSQHPEFTLEQYAKIEGIRSFAPWPYADNSLFLVQIGFLKFEGINYVALWDLYFTDPGKAGALVIAKYIDSPVRYSEWMTTDRLDIVCKVM